ncbi:MAG TPA: FAD-binding oxidoreductase [Bryobacteraceae bacterium]|jgi:FAD/FMN-containing dehydrogenase|nr:FAD-binding oxidoreductase [Bryobacteraceae bacterium]
MDITDASGYAGRADQVFSPRNEEEIAAILVRASAEGVPVTVMGALTGLAGGAVPKSGWAISMAQFRKLDVYPGKARVGSGVLLRDVQAAAAASGQFYAPDPTENTSSIGGNIGANASGSRSFRYGATRQHVQALRVVHMDGSIAEYRRGDKVDFDVPRIPLPRTRKHSAGYRLEPGMDFVDLFIGSEGTLGVVTEAELQLLPAPGEILGGVVFFPTEEAALDAVDRWRPTPGLRMLEFLDSHSIKVMEQPHGAAVLLELEGDAGLDSELDMTGALESESWFGSSAADRERFRQFRHRLPERIHEHLRRAGFVVLATDYAVPLERNRDILAVYRSVLSKNFGDKFVMFGHIGDAHVHTEILPETRQEWERGTEVAVELAQEVVAMGGTVGAEHGLGKRKAHLLSIQYNPAEIEAMRSVKRRFDPQGLLGQGNLFS